LQRFSEERSVKPNLAGILRYEDRIASNELRDAIAEGPILFRGLKNVYEHILRPDAGAFAKQLYSSPEQRFLLFRGASVEHRDLDIHEIIAAGDVKIGRAVAEVCSVMLRDDHKLITSGTFKASRIAR
jgi:hypothetical protein